MSFKEKGYELNLTDEIKTLDNSTPEDYLKALAQENPWQKIERLASMCGRCIINCPTPNEELDNECW